MKTIYGIAQIMFLCFAIVNFILENGQANDFVIMAFEMAILYKLEN